MNRANVISTSTDYLFISSGQLLTRLFVITATPVQYKRLEQYVLQLLDVPLRLSFL